MKALFLLLVLALTTMSSTIAPTCPNPYGYVYAHEVYPQHAIARCYKVTGATSYDWECWAADGTGRVEKDKTTYAATYFGSGEQNDTHLVPGKKYFWHVKANCSNWSLTKSFTTPLN